MFRLEDRVRPIVFVEMTIALSALWPFGGGSCQAAPQDDSVLIGNYLRSAPCGIAWIVRNSAAFVMDTGGPYAAGIAAPDESYHKYQFVKNRANIVFEWGRTADCAVGRLTADQAIDLTVTLSTGWPGWTSTFEGSADGASGVAQTDSGKIEWALKTSPVPKSTSQSALVVTLVPGVPVRFAAGVGNLPDLDSVDAVLLEAQKRYEATRPQASGDWGDFVGAIADNMNNSRLYANDNKMLAHSVSRTWSSKPNGSPYFCWDSFFTANLAALEDPVGAQNTVRAILSCQTPEGLVPNFGHWDAHATVSTDRSQPPVGSWCVWKIHQRRPNDRDFLGEVYPKLVLWHDWWMQARDAKHDGLLEWGSATGTFQNAQYETGWDDNLHYQGAQMSGATMNCYSVDLSSMWAMDAHYLALIADFLGLPNDAARFRKDEVAMNQRINSKLWNASLNCYCSRFWDDVEGLASLDDSVYGSGFDGDYFSDENLQQRVASHHDKRIDFNWNGRSPIQGVPGVHWSAQWKGTFTAPTDGLYRFVASADDGVRVIVDGKTLIDDWAVHPAKENSAKLSMTQGKSVSIIVQYFQHEFGSELHFSVHRVLPKGSFLTRATPMNFYPLTAGAPDSERAKIVLDTLTDPGKFWGKYLLPTLAYDDPDWHQQEYWRGDVWGPTNYITWLGIKKYASLDRIGEYGERNVDLFMHEWLRDGSCSENYLSTNGTHSRDPHYTWGALLNLIALESIVDVDDTGAVVLNGRQRHKLTLKNIPLIGHVFDVVVEPGKASLIEGGRTVLTAKDRLERYVVDSSSHVEPDPDGIPTRRPAPS